MVRKLLASFACAALLIAAGAGCARRAAGSDRGAVTPSVEPTGWQTFAVAHTSIDAVRLSDGDRTLTFDVRLPGGRDGCARNLTAEVQQDEGWTDTVARIELLMESRPSLGYGACPTEVAAAARVALPGPLGTRDVVVNSSSVSMYTPDSTGGLRHCAESGCHPAPTGCTPASYEQAMRAADSPQHTFRRERGCDGRWLVLDLSVNGGPVCGDSPGHSMCPHAVNTTRWFFRATPQGWQVITGTREAGCVAVQKVEPAFPTALCVTLAQPEG